MNQKNSATEVAPQVDKLHTEYNTVQLCSGNGQYHSPNAKENPRPYNTVTLAEIEAMLANPPEVPKPQAQWCIFSTLPSRVHDEQRKAGSYYALWADIDDPQGMTLAEMFSQAITALPFNLMAYTSKSSTQDNQKARLIVPLAEPVQGAAYSVMQKILNDKLENAGIKPDRVTQRNGQICYLPNKGEFYDYQENPFSGALSAADWTAEIEAEQQRIEAEQSAQKQRLEQSRLKAVQRMATGEQSPINAFNAAYDVELMLTTFGYMSKGGRYISPLSQSGSAAVTVKDGKWTSHHGSDNAAGLGAMNDKSHRFGDAFDLYTFFEHGNDRTAAIKAAGAMFTTADGVSLTRANQRNYMAAQAQNEALQSFDSLPANDATQSQPQVDNWPDPVNPFAEYVAPPFPLEVMPKAFQEYALCKGNQSGFDAGGYAFSLLIIAANTIDHRAKLDAKIMHVPPNLWGGLNGPSGSGKTPVMGAAKKFACAIDERRTSESMSDLKAWKKHIENAAKEEKKTMPKPEWHQRITLDITTEALGILLTDNPEGVLTVQDEITEFIGRMDAYSGNGSGKDRGTYLRSYDGGRHTINRASKEPLVVENFSVGILAGIQPEKLAQLYKQNGGGSDGLYQRFLMYTLAPPAEVNYFADSNSFLDMNVQAIFETLSKWTKPDARLSGQCLNELQKYHNTIRTLAQRTAGKRFAEHLDKYPGFICRLTFVLHCLECAEKDEFKQSVDVATFEKAKAIMKVLYRHSEAIYQKLETQAFDVMDLVKGACEAALSKNWTQIQRGDLTRYATGWQGADTARSEAAIDYLIEIGWLFDITPPTIPGRRGRRSDGLFAVNPKVHDKFKEHTSRITLARQERFQAIKQAAAERGK